MAKRGSYERRGNATSSDVEARKAANKPPTQKEMEAAFKAWKKNKAKGETSISRTIIAGGTRSDWESRLSESENITRRRKDKITR